MTVVGKIDHVTIDMHFAGDQVALTVGEPSRKLREQVRATRQAALAP